MDDVIQTNIGSLKILRAERKDQQSVLAILRDAALWLDGKGIMQWQGMEEKSYDPIIEQKISEGTVFVAWLEGDAVGTVRIEWEDPNLWGQRGKDGLGGYIHGLAVMRKWAGKGVGKDILIWASKAIREVGKTARLDIVASNPVLARYYEAFGFKCVGESPPIQDWKPNKLYEFSQ